MFSLFTFSSGKARNAAEAAGRWGDYRDCDSPRSLVENMLRHISLHHPVSHAIRDFVHLVNQAAGEALWSVTIIANFKHEYCKYYFFIPIERCQSNNKLKFQKISRKR